MSEAIDPAVPRPPAAVTRQVDLDVDVDSLWHAVVDDEERSAWWGGDTTLEVAPGGAGHATDPDGTARHIRVDEVDDDGVDGRRLSFRWWPEDGGPASAVELVVAPRPGGSRLTVTETRPAPFRATMCAGRLLDLELLVLCRSHVPTVAAGRG